MGTRSFLIFMLIVLVGIVIGAIAGSKKDKPRRDQYWAEYKRFQDKVVSGEVMTEEDTGSAGRWYDSFME